jgi:hypothetical protein
MWRITHPPFSVRSSVLHENKMTASNQAAVAIVVSGLQSRCLKPCIDSLARYVIQPHTQANYQVDVFVVLQRSKESSFLKQVDYNTFPSSSSSSSSSSTNTHPSQSKIADEFYVRRVIEDPAVGGRVITYAAELAPSMKQLNKWYWLDNQRNPLMYRYQNKKEGYSKWKRNIFMYHNISKGFQEAQWWEKGLQKPYTAYIRTRSDNIFFNTHPLYPRMSARDLIVLPCKSYKGINDKFLVFMSQRAVNAFAHVLQHKAGNINRFYQNSEGMWGRSLQRHGVHFDYFANYQIVMSHLGLGKDGKTCYRWTNNTCTTPSVLKQQNIQGNECQQ